MLTNEQVAEQLACSPSTVSRLRSGDRTPSVSMVLNIETAYRWSGQEQLDALRDGDYGPQFEKALAAWETMP